MAIQDVDVELRHRWRRIAKEQFTRALIKEPSNGRIYHHLAILECGYSWPHIDFFGTTLSKLFYFTKSLVVAAPYLPAWDSLLTVISQIVARNDAAAKDPTSIPQTGKDHFLAAVVHLLLASLDPNKLRAHGYNDSKKYHLLAVYTALEKINTDKLTNRICPRYLFICDLVHNLS